MRCGMCRGAQKGEKMERRGRGERRAEDAEETESARHREGMEKIWARGQQSRLGQMGRRRLGFVCLGNSMAGER